MIIMIHEQSTALDTAAPSGLPLKAAGQAADQAAAKHTFDGCACWAKR